MRQQLAGLWPQAREDRPVPPERNERPVAAHLLRHVPAIGDDQLQRPQTAAAPHAKLTQHQPPNDSAGGADVNHYAEAHPHRQADATARASRQEHEGVVIARFGVARRPRGHGDRRAAARAEREALWTNAEPGIGRALRAARNDLRAPTEIKREAGSPDIDHDAAAPGVRDSDGRGSRSGERQMGR